MRAGESWNLISSRAEVERHSSSRYTVNVAPLLDAVAAKQGNNPSADTGVTPRASAIRPLQLLTNI